MTTSSLFSSCPNHERSYLPSLEKFLPSLEKMKVPQIVSSFFASMSPSYSNEHKNPPLIGIIDQLSLFGKTLERYHPGKIKGLFATFKQQYEENKENITSLKEEHKKLLKEFEKIGKNVLKIDFPDQRKEEIKNSFKKFSDAFKTLIDTYDSEKLDEASTLLNAFNETIMRSYQLYIGLDKVISYIERQGFLLPECKELKLSSLQILQQQFDPNNLEDQGLNQIIEQNAQRSGLFDIIADASVVLKTLSSEVNPLPYLKNDHIKIDLLETILKKSKETASFIKANQKTTQEIMRFYLTDTKSACCKTLENNLAILLREQPYLFTKREKKALIQLQKDLAAISYGKVFNKKDLQEQLNQCQDIVKELLPKKTIFLQMTNALSKLEFSLIRGKITSAERKEIKALLDTFIDNPKTPFQPIEKENFLNLRAELLSLLPDQDIPENKRTSLEAKSRSCQSSIKEIKKRHPFKEGSKLAIGQEIQKLAKHATNLSFMMLIDKKLFNPTRDSLFYRNIIQKSEETSSCPKKLFLAELKTEGFSTWKILSAKVYFFVVKHLRIESYTQNLISRVITNYSKIIYQKLDQEHNQDQYRLFSQKILENATMYFQLLGSATSKAKENAQGFPNQITQLIVEQLLLLKPEETEAALKELNLNDFYDKLVNDLVEKSESRLLRWIVPWLDKHKIISSIIETGTDSLIKPTPNGNASSLNLLIRDGLKALYKKLQQPKQESEPQDPLPSHPTAKAFAENLIRALNEHRAIQQVASYTKIILANQNHIEKLKKQTPQLEGIIDQQIKALEAINYTMMVKLDFLKKQALQEEKRQSLSMSPIIKNIEEKFLKIPEMLMLHPASEASKQRNASFSINEIISDKTKNSIRHLVNEGIEKDLTEALTKLLTSPPSEELVHDLIHQGLWIANQAIACPKENKETQKAVEEEIMELLHDISSSIANGVPSTLAKNLTGINRSSKLAEKIPYDLPSLISPLIQERLQDIVDLTRQKTLYRPELIIQLGRRIFFPVNAA
ncbi:MAG: hypothetical protein ACRCU0_01295 [Candidatus Rhabdochlamydia sp.]